MVLLLEEMGYHVCPSPFFATVVLGALPILMEDTEEQKKDFLPKIASGERLLTLALTDLHTRWIPTSPRVSAFFDGREYVIDATKLFVPYAHAADHFLLVARTQESRDPWEGLMIFVVDARTPRKTLTRLENLQNDKQFEAVFDQIFVSPENIVGGLDKGGPIVIDVLAKAAVARGAEMVGGAQAAMDMAMKFAGERVQYKC